MKKGTAGENVNRWFSYCSSQPEFKKIQKLVSNNIQAPQSKAEKLKPSSVCIELFISVDLFFNNKSYQKFLQFSASYNLLAVSDPKNLQYDISCSMIGTYHLEEVGIAERKSSVITAELDFQLQLNYC